MKPYSILIADDYAIVRRGLRILLESQRNWKVVAEATHGREAVAQAMELHPRVAILDFNMPHLNGLDACRLISKALPRTRVLLLTIHRDPEVIAKIVKAGASGYVVKPDAGYDLVSAVEALLYDRTYFSGSGSDAYRETINLHEEGESPLSVREMEIIQLVVEGKSNKEAASILGISTRTAENHRARVMHKLGLRSLSDLVRYAVRNKMVEA